MRIPDTVRRLEEWGRWSRAADPLHLARPGERLEWNTVTEAPVQISPIFEFWSSYGNWDEMWGDECPAEPRPDPPNDRECDEIDKILGSARVARYHRQIIKEWYWKLRKRRITQDDHDGAVRALADILYPLLSMREAA